MAGESRKALETHQPNRGAINNPLDRWEIPPGLGGRVALGMVRFYQRTFSAVLPPSCRFVPSCSEYTAQAIIKYGALKGAWLGAKRIARCHPFNPGGYDPVP